jgi:hypothetical protein
VAESVLRRVRRAAAQTGDRKGSRSLMNARHLRSGARVSSALHPERFCGIWSAAGQLYLQARSTELPTFCAVFLRGIRANIERRLEVRRQHTMPRSTTNRTRFCLQRNLCSTACTKSGHVLCSPVTAPLMNTHPAKIQDGPGRRLVYTQ